VAFSGPAQADELGGIAAVLLASGSFVESLQRLVPDIRADDLSPGGAGVRAQAMSPDGNLVQDFCLLHRPRALHVLNAPSPGATASLAIGEEIAKSGCQGILTPLTYRPFDDENSN